MTGRCKRRRKDMDGDRNTADREEIDCPNSSPQITEKPSGVLEITELPLASALERDYYSQAAKALAFHSPYDSEESAGAASVSGLNVLPVRVLHVLGRQSDGRKRQKKTHTNSDKKKSAGPGKPSAKTVWIDTEEYFREVTIVDIERLEKCSNVEFIGDENCLPINPSGNDNRTVKSDDLENVSLCMGNEIELSDDREDELKEVVVMQEENGPTSMDVDAGEALLELEVKEESNGGKIENGNKDFAYLGGLEWLLGSRSKIYLSSERPSKKRKLLGRDAGLEKLLVAHPAEGLDSTCHYCSFGDMSDLLNCLIKCASCGMVVHQRCYGVAEDVDSSWLCSWCKCKNGTSLSGVRPCLLCPMSGGALKPVAASSEDDRTEVKFAHLFCCQWMPEVYIENTRTMEPVMKIEELNDTRKKLICYLCKVKWGACVRCSNGACRTSFHPSCAREARHRMEIWGKLGCDEVELRAFCSKHSGLHYDRRCRKGEPTSDESGSRLSKGKQMLAALSKSQKLGLGQANGDKLDTLAETADVDPSDMIDDCGGNLVDSRSSSESHSENGDVLRPSDKDATDTNGYENVNASSRPNFTMILKKLIDMGKVDVKDVAVEIGVSPDSLSMILTDNHMIPEIQLKLLKWLKNHAHIGSLQKTTKLRIRSPADSKPEADVAECASAVSMEESDISEAVPVCRGMNGNVMKTDKSCISEDKSDKETTVDDLCPGVAESNGACTESLSDITEKMSIDPEPHKHNPANNSLKSEATAELSRSLSEDGKPPEQLADYSPGLSNGEGVPTSYIHLSKLPQENNCAVGDTESLPLAGVREDSQLEASTSSGPCCSKHNAQASSGDCVSRCEGLNLDRLPKEANLDILKFSPGNEVEGELIYYQQRILYNAFQRKRISDDLMSKVARSLPLEIEASGREKWDDVVVSQYNHELREAKKKGRKERRHKEAQAVLAAATAAAAASSRLSTRKDSLEESANPEDLKTDVYNVKPAVNSQLNPRVKNTISRSTVSRPSSDGNSDFLQIPANVRKDRPRICEICIRSETILNPVLVCSSCKVAVHLDCYRSVKSTPGPWHCELCEDLLLSQGTGSLATNSLEKPYFVAECGLCGGTASAFRKSMDGQWIHALCAEWVLESKYRRGQVNPIEGTETVSKGNDTCSVCHRKQGVCLKCSYGHCQSTFHPTCARSAGFYMTVRTAGGKLQHKAYCEKHSTEQRAKADTQKHGIEEFKSLKQVRVELERLRLLCERIIKREKLKRELVLCSHDILASNRDSVLSALARHPFYQPEVSSESATTSIKGCSQQSGSETAQRSDDITIDSTVAGKRRVKLCVSLDNDQRTVDSSTSHNLYTLKPPERVTFSGKQIQRPSAAPVNLSEDVESRSKFKKQIETLEKELIMTSDQASMKNQRLPKGYVYVPIRSLSKDKDNIPDASGT